MSNLLNVNVARMQNVNVVVLHTTATSIHTDAPRPRPIMRGAAYSAARAS